MGRTRRRANRPLVYAIARAAYRVVELAKEKGAFHYSTPIRFWPLMP